MVKRKAMALIPIGAIVLASCSNPPDERREKNTPKQVVTKSEPQPEASEALIPGSVPTFGPPNQIQPSPPPPQVAQVNEELSIRVCRAAIAMLMNQNPDIIQAIGSNSNMARVTYIRPDDKKVWTNDCMITSGSRVLWRAVEPFGPGSGIGRWRDTAYDEAVYFGVSPTMVTIRVVSSDGSGSSVRTYTI